MPKARIMEVVQYEINPKTGEDLHFGEANIISALSHKTIKQYAYVRHDGDPYTEHDFEEYVKNNGDEPAWKAGDIKPAHWHCPFKCSPALDLEVVARWFGVPVQQVRIIHSSRGRDGFLDCVQYLTHEDDKQQALGKRLYPDEAVTANFDFRKEIDDRIATRLKYGKDMTPAEKMLHDVLYNGKTINECIAEDQDLYAKNIDKIRKFRLDYLHRVDPPATRINYYMSADGGIGKGLMARGLARALFPNYEYDDDIYFEVGEKGSLFEGYDGQPVIIWNDRRAYDLLDQLGGRGNVFTVFDTHPTRQRQNIKYGSVNLINSVNIVNSVESYKDFLEGLVGEYKDKNGRKVKSEHAQISQSQRRFPMIINLHEDDFDLLINLGFANGSRDFDAYIGYERIRGNMQRIAEACGRNQALAREIQSKTLKPVTDEHHRLLENLEDKEQDEDTIRSMFSDYGTVKGGEENE